MEETPENGRNRRILHMPMERMKYEMCVLDYVTLHNAMNNIKIRLGF